MRQKTLISLCFIDKLIYFPESKGYNLLKNCLRKSGTVLNFKKSIGKIKKDDGNWTSIVRINNSNANISKLQCKAGPGGHLAKMTF